MMNSRLFNQTSLKGVRYASNQAKKVNAARAAIPTRFPTQFNPIRSASNPRIQLPKGLSYNPAPSAPSPYNTPNAFLPESDKRQIRYETEPYSIKDIPELTPSYEKKYNLTEQDVLEIQKLRLEDPEKWTRKALAKKFNCTPLFISMVSKPDPSRQQEMDRRLNVIKSLWTETRTRTRRDRERRKKLALRDAN